MLNYVEKALEKAPTDATHYIIYDDTKEVSILKLNPTRFWFGEIKKWIEAEPHSIRDNLHKAIEIR